MKGVLRTYGGVVFVAAVLAGCSAGDDGGATAGPGTEDGPETETPSGEGGGGGVASPGGQGGASGWGGDAGPSWGGAGQPAVDAGTGLPETDGGGSVPPVDDWDPTSVTCNPVVGGTGSVSIKGAPPRSYFVDLPFNQLQPMALMFSWHGFNQAPIDFKNQLRFDPNGASMPIVIVTPTDTKLFLPYGLDWFILGSDGNVDFPYFRGMLQCLESQFNIDKERVYSFGFSAGAVFTNLIASRWPDLFAATVSESGAWFSDPAEVNAIVVGGTIMPWNWPALNPADGGNVLMTHGGPGDFATIISIEAAAQAALPFLLQNQRTVVDCPHLGGHVIHPTLNNRMIFDYLLAHRLGQPSPFKSGAPAPFGCTVRTP